MKSPILKTQKMISEFEQRFGLDLEIKKISFHSKGHLAFYHPKKCEITLPNQARGKELKEFLYHELGHAILARYQPPKDLLDLFVFVCPQMDERYACKMMDREEAAPDSWVSWYAMTNPVEDFCETLAAWASNDFKVSQIWRFSGFEFNPRRDLTLRKKVEAVRMLMRYLKISPRKPKLS
jgi:hypothetical protein